MAGRRNGLTPRKAREVALLRVRSWHAVLQCCRRENGRREGLGNGGDDEAGAACSIIGFAVASPFGAAAQQLTRKYKNMLSIGGGVKMAVLMSCMSIGKAQSREVSRNRSLAPSSL